MARLATALAAAILLIGLLLIAPATAGQTDTVDQSTESEVDASGPGYPVSLYENFTDLKTLPNRSGKVSYGNLSRMANTTEHSLLELLFPKNEAIPGQKDEKVRRGRNWVDKPGEGNKRTLQLYTGPVNFYNGTGYQRINTTIQRTGNQQFQVTRGIYQAYWRNGRSFRVQNDGYSLYFKEKGLLRSAVAGDKQGKDPDGRVGPTVSPPRVDRNTISYEHYYPGVTLNYTYGPTRLKQDFIIERRLPGNGEKKGFKFRGDLRLPDDLEIRVDGDPLSTGRVETSKPILFRNGSGSAIFRIPEPVIIDGDGDRTTGTYVLKRQGPKKIQLTLETPQEWLRSKSRTYPVRVDPSVEAVVEQESFEGDTYVSEYNPYDNFEGYKYLHVFEDNQDDRWALLKFWPGGRDDLGDISSNQINSAELELKNTYRSDTRFVKAFYTSDDSWYASFVTWNERPRPDSYQDSVATFNTGWYSWDVTDAVVSDWGYSEVVSFILLDDGWGEGYNAFYASEKSTSDAPRLTIEYEEENEEPVAVADAYPKTVNVGELVTFDGSESYDPDGSISTYAWSLDGESRYGELVTHRYGSPGTYDVTLGVEDDSGDWAHDTVTIRVEEKKPDLAIYPEDITFEKVLGVLRP